MPDPNYDQCREAGATLTDKEWAVIEGAMGTARWYWRIVDRPQRAAAIKAVMRKLGLEPPE